MKSVLKLNTEKVKRLSQLVHALLQLEFGMQLNGFTALVIAVTLAIGDDSTKHELTSKGSLKHFPTLRK